MIREQTINEIRERVDIVALVSEYVRLKRMGQSFKGLCPFHSEKTPSFHVRQDRRVFHCFGCGASGDAIGFIMRLEGRTFPEAARILAERAGIEIEEDRTVDRSAVAEARHHKERLYALLDAAAGFYVKQLREHPHGSMAREEYARRGVSAETAKSFRLGYAPPSWDALTTYLLAHEFTAKEGEEAGLLVPKRQGGPDGRTHYDRFRHRLLFPISDPSGRIVAFSGRALAPPPGETPRQSDGPPAKYVNSPEGPLYKKGELLFGLYEGRVTIRREGWAILCEGNFDLVALHQAGFSMAVAPLGTAFTAQQAKLLKRYAERVVLLFDSDNAGRKAVKAAEPLLRDAGIAAAVVTLPDGEDPDSFLRARGKEALQGLVDAAPGIVEYLIDAAAAESAGDARGKAEAIESLGPLIAAVARENPAEIPIHIQRLMQRFGVHDPVALKRQLAKGARAASQAGTRRNEPSANASSATSREGVTQGGPRRPTIPTSTASLPELEAEVVGAVLDQPELISSGVELFEELLTSDDLRAILRAAKRIVEARGQLDGPALLAEVEGNAAHDWLAGRISIAKYEELSHAKALLERAASRLRVENIRREMDQVNRAILDAVRRGDEERAVALRRKLNDLLGQAGRTRG